MLTGNTYRSKIVLEILVPTVLGLGTLTAFAIINFDWLGAMTCLLVWLLIINIYKTTYYKITSDNRLIIKSWIIEAWEIEINDILSITKRESDSGPAALSIDRLEVNYNGGQVLISPTNKKKFISDLRKVNARIQACESTREVDIGSSLSLLV